jgi:23S rRNA (adenine2503-C2)-methyltransferase
MKNLSKDVRSWLEAHYEIGHSDIAEIRGGAEDGTQKILFRLRDGKIVESVLMQDRDWQTLCISSQVGCAVACTFCMTGFGGFRRHMTRGEILSQFLLAKRLVNNGTSPRNIVFMGMGEPMLNLDQVIPALRLLTDSNGMDVSPRRITVSTSGILPGIQRLGEADTGVNIAISLNASNNTFRNQIMPINKAYPIEALLDACRAFPLKSRRRITFEYVLLGGLNDQLQNARELAGLLRGLPCKVNLIPWNPDAHLPYQRPDEESVRRFQQFLLDHHYTVSVRYSKGVDIGAACGQLAGHWEAEQKTA